MAVIDNVTRWSSTFKIFKRLLESRDVVKELEGKYPKGSFAVQPYQWKQIKELQSILKKPSIATQIFQFEDLTPGHFVYIWELLKEQLMEGDFEKSVLAKAIKHSMEIREAILMTNPFFCAAVFADLHYQCLLNEEQQVFFLIIYFVRRFFKL